MDRLEVSLLGVRIKASGLFAVTCATLIAVLLLWLAK
jgi:hypothetical protein